MLAHSPSLHEKQQGVLTPSINTQIFRENMNFWNMNQGRQPFSPKKTLSIVGMAALFSLAMPAQLFATQYSEQTKLTISANNQTVKEILYMIEGQSDFRFIYESGKVDLDKRVTVNFKNQSVEAILDNLFGNAGIQYEITENNFILINPVGNSSKDTKAVAQQQKRITGKVVDKNGEPIIGANVVVKGTTNGAVTDMDGNFSLSVTDGAVLEISYIGYLNQEIKVGNQKKLSISLSEDTQNLDEVVVVGYGTMEKKQVTSAVTSISADKMMVGVSGSDITTALQGKVSSLVMNNLGGPNSSTTIQLRGLTSINSGRSPLIVIDGFPGGDIRSLTQEDIKSIDVLKDGSAGAIYGTRAASGVILITTKSGSNTNGKVKMTYSNELTKKQNFNAPEMLSAEEYVEHGISTDFGADVNWWDEMINKKNFSQKHHIALELGTEKAQVYTSFFYETNEGIAINDSRRDYGGRLNANFKLLDDWLEIRPAVDYRQAARESTPPNFQLALINNPTRSPYDENSATGYNVWLDDINMYNTIADSYQKDNYGLDKWFKPEVTLKLNVKPVPGLSYQQVIGYENRQWENHTYQPSDTRDEIFSSRKGSAYLGFSKTESLTSEGYFSYVHEFNGGHSLNATMGYSYFELNGEGFNMSNYNFSVDGIKYWDMNQGSYIREGKASMSSTKNITEKLLAYFGRVNYSYQDKYLASASIRREGSSKFATANRWANFWSATAGWRISNEEFMKDINWVHDLKLRFGYGVTGNNDFSASYMANLLGSDNNWMLPNGNWAFTYGKSQNVNPNLAWEEKHEWNAGVDYSLFDGRFYGKFDYYRRKITSLLYSVSVPQSPYTQGSQWQNIGELESKGWEFEVGGDIIKNKDFSWTSNLNMSHNSGKVLTLWGNNTYYNGNGFASPGTPGSAARIEEGSTIGAFYIWKFAGFDDAGNFLVYNKDGEVIPADQKTENDKQYIGNYNPTLILGWNNTFSYKNLDLSIN